MRSLLYALTVLSLPMRGAWIEIYMQESINEMLKSLPMRGAWIEILYARYLWLEFWSLPMRGAWIEITTTTTPLDGR